MKIETLAIHAGRAVDAATGAVREPIHLSTTFERSPEGGYPHGFSYARADNPNRASLERAVAALESGTQAVAFASGSAASLAVFSLAAPGGRILCSEDCYHGTAAQLRELLPRFGIRSDFVDMTDLSEVARALGDVADLAHARGALLACDNTFASPVLQRPLELGADIVMHSSTKYLGGHSDILGGVVVPREAGPSLERLREFQSSAGGIPSPFDCWLLLRSLATLPCRVRGQAANALTLARFLAADRRVLAVHYPGLDTHPGHELAARQMHGGYGGVISFQVPGDAAAALAVVARTTIFTRATSLGGVESLIEHRASIEGPLTTTPPNLIRLSVGLENAEDLVRDLDQALGS
jgi:cystathionine gamma-synthase